MTGYTENTRGRYKCLFCDHKTYKTAGGAQRHVEETHPKDLELARALKEIDRLKNQAPKIVEKERVVYRDAPKPKEVKYWYGVVGIFCSTCRRVQSNPGIPVGQTIENTPCSNCRNHTLMRVEEIN